MKQAIMITIICIHQPAIDVIVAQIPLQHDPRIWPNEYQPATVVLSPADPVFGTQERQILTATFRCHDDIDQAAIAEALIQAVLNNAPVVLGGSSIKLHTCYHDEIPPRGCEETILYEVA